MFFEPDLTHESNKSHLYCWLDDSLLLFDIGDFQDTLDERLAASAEVVFKFHYSKSHHARYSNVFPFSPISFYDWDEYRTLANEITYSAEGAILSNQRTYAQASERRAHIQSLLRRAYGSSFDNALTSQHEFWRKINKALVSICVPGARADILDRGQLQYMAFGACTISPRLSIVLPYGKQLIPNVHYLECRPDSSDLIDKIEWTKHNREKCIQIGTNAKNLFSEMLTAEALFKWILLCLNRVHSQTSGSSAA